MVIIIVAIISSAAIKANKTIINFFVEQDLQLHVSYNLLITLKAVVYNQSILATFSKEREILLTFDKIK